MKISILLMLFSLFSVSTCKQNDEDEIQKTNHSMSIDNELMKTIDKTNATLNNAKMNGDFDYDFAYLMIMHHQMAIDMSKVQIEKGSDQTIVNMAKGIVAAQEIEIREMQEFIKKNIIPVKNNEISNSAVIATEMKSMMSKMHEINLTQNIDKDYVAMMIPHHETAIAMSKMQIKFGTQNDLIQLSKNIVEDQTFEIDEFKKWQSH